MVQYFKFYYFEGSVLNEAGSTPTKDNPQGVVTKTIPTCRCAHIVDCGSHDFKDEKFRYL